MAIKTRAILITERYNTLTAKLKTFFDAELFPSLDSIDVADLVFFVSVKFVGIEKPEDFEGIITDLITCHGFKITDEQLITVVPLIRDFMLWLRDL
jgi:hypothetical protein